MLTPMLTVAGVVAAGVVCQWFAWRIKVPAIVPLLVAGLILGPATGLLHPQEQLGDPFYILLAANVTVDDLRLLDWRAFAVLMVVMFTVRPLGILLSTWGSSLNRNERLFLAWIALAGHRRRSSHVALRFRAGPRGRAGPGADERGCHPRPLVFLIIAGTVFIRAARPSCGRGGLA